MTVAGSRFRSHKPCQALIAAASTHSTFCSWSRRSPVSAHTPTEKKRVTSRPKDISLAWGTLKVNIQPARLDPGYEHD